jgi:hypothetical protein
VGIGLHLSRELMHRQGGTFIAALTSNGGLDVVMTLPAPSAGPRRAPRPRAARSVDGGHGRRF